MNLKRKRINDKKSYYRGRAFFNEKRIKESINRPVVLEYFRENGDSFSREIIIGILKNLSYDNMKINFGKVSTNSGDSVKFLDSEHPFNFFNLLSIFDEKGRLLYYNRCLHKSFNDKLIPQYTSNNPLVATILN